MDSRALGILLLFLAAALAVLGLLVYSGAFGWFGRLPGDIRIERESTRVYFPIASMIVVSIVLSVLLSLFRRFF